MKPKMICKLGIDLIMIVLLLLLMAKQITGNFVHEWIGTGMFIFYMLHHVLNFQWYTHLFRGKYTPFRVVQFVVNLLLLLSMFGTMISAIVLSREVFVFLPISSGIALARPTHILCTFWSFTLISLHLGLHWNMVLGMLRKAFRPISSKHLKIALRMGSVAIATYGFYAFIKNQFLSYMFLTSSFVFFDFERPIFLFFTEYIAIMGLFVFLTYYGAKGLKRLSRKRN
ncbi:MAG: DUF4405 domain-containing protein [Clostridiales bacterium]|nr:DUF4405 domain-containing protein [Clostridiales bacterium]